MRWGTSIVDHDRSYPDGHPAVRVDDANTHLLHGAARELEAHLLHEQTRHLAEVRSLLAELYQRDGVQVDDDALDVQAEDVAARERGEVFLQELATRLHPGAELLELAGQLDDHALGVWREAAASLVDEAPPCLLQLRWRVEEEQRGELRGHAHLVRTEAHLGAQLRRYSLIVRLWRYRQVAELRGKLADCRTLRERSERRLAFMDAKLQVIQRVEQARAVWITQAREVLARGLAAAQLLAERQQQRDDDQQTIDGPSWPAVLEDRVRLGVVS
jgi:hypothetical protein